MDVSRLQAEAERRGIFLDASQVQSFSEFGDALYERNEVTNLTRIPEAHCWVKHFLDSLLMCPYLPPGASVLDVGSGPGFPAWPVACARMDVSVTALDGSNKGLQFLRSHLLPNLRVKQARAEEFDEREAYDVVTGRALAPVAVQLETSAAFARIGGSVVPFRTPQDLDALKAFPAEKLGLELAECHQVALPDEFGERLFPVFVKRSRTPRTYPRRWAEIRARPLV